MNLNHSKENLLSELWSHSMDIDDTCEMVLDVIQDSIVSAQCHTILKNKIYLYQNDVDVTLFGIKIILRYNIYDFPDTETLYKYFNECFAENGVSNDLDVVILTLYTINGESVDKINKGNIFHELEHLLQSSYGMKNNKSFRSIINNDYDRAQSVIRNNDGSFNEYDKKVAFLFYFSDPREQDAFMNTYYYDIVYGKETMDTRTNNVLRTYENLIDWYYKNKSNPNVINAVRAYRGVRMPKKNFDTMLRKGLNRFKKKMRNVEKITNERRSAVSEARTMGISLMFPKFGARRLIY